jgi:hypothetical protein
MSKTYVVMKVQVVNHGNDEAAAVKCALGMALGTWQSSGTVMNIVPSAWRIRKKRDGSFLGNVYDDHPLEPLLRASQVYKKGHPCTGWLAFETYAYGDVEFPNVEFDIILTDSLGGIHHIKRQPGVYPRTGELVRIEQNPIPTASLP